MGETYSKKRLDAIEAKVRRQAYLDQSIPELSGKGKINLLFTCLYHGQLALKHLQGSDKKSVYAYLRSVIRQTPLTGKEMVHLSALHRGWLWLAQHSLALTCRFRNLFHIGM